jgi:hypothetical protein
MKLRLPFLLLLTWLLLNCDVFSQINVSLHLPRTSFLLNEPTIATLTISNLAGQDLLFEDSPDFGPWCHLELKALRGDFVSPRSEQISFPPLIVPSGKTINRTINISEFFFMEHPGQYKIRVGVFFTPTRAEFYTQATFNGDPGRIEWAQTVGIPQTGDNGGKFRTFSLVTHQRPEGIFLYAKLEGKEEGIRFAPFFLGRLLSAMKPQPQFDASNNLYVFHASSDSTYVLSQIDVDTGKFGQALYRPSTPRAGRPSMSKDAKGHLVISGGIRVHEEELTPKSTSKSLLSERPAEFQSKPTR